MWAWRSAESGYAYVTGLVFSYGDMRDATHEMQQDLTALRLRISEHAEMRTENVRLRKMLSFRKRSSQFTLMPAEIIQHASGILTIDRGSIHDVRESMCVITPDGIVGLITRVGPLTSNVVTLQSPDCKVDAMIKRTRVRSRVNGSGNDLRAVCSMHYIDLKHDVRLGDEIVTSPDSVFPSGYPIGRVDDFPEEGQLSKSVAIMPAVNPFRIDEVFVLLSASLDWKELANQREDPAASGTFHELLDTETIQSRLAP